MKNISLFLCAALLLAAAISSCDINSLGISPSETADPDSYPYMENGGDAPLYALSQIESAQNVPPRPKWDYTADPDKEFIKTDPLKNSDYNETMTAYNEFLQGKTKVYYHSIILSINSLINDRGKNDNIRYALYDMNGDGIPELIVESKYCYIFSYKTYAKANREMFVLFAIDDNAWGTYLFLENGAILNTFVPGMYDYITFDLHGIDKIVFFSGRQGDETKGQYWFESDEVTKEEWDELTKEYFASIQRPAMIELFDYWTK